ncbi:MAG TPA: hypothetical protein VGO80_14025 [Solirubrobacteraceae bacterium]|nr:hypothetical protein [Solirubrobacteraceae bacterium]
MHPRLALLIACGALLVAPASAQSVAPAEALRLLNVQRSANGIPGDVAESAGLTDGCTKHAAYIGLNGGVLGSGEDPAKPGYTPDGDRQTLASSGVELLSHDATWSETTNPWLLAPIDLFRLFDPEVAVAGYADAAGAACLRVRGGRAAPPAPELYSVPGTGRSGVPTSEVNVEQPYAPQQLVDIPAGQPTGPNILLFTRGLRGSRPLVATAFSLTGLDGPVGAHLVTEATTSAAGSGAWFRGGGVLVPAAPLAPFTTYVARVTWHRDAEQGLAAATAEQVVEFETDGLPNTVDVSVVSRDDVNEVRVATPAPNPTLTVTGPGRLTDVTQLRDGVATYPALEPGTWTACARSGGRAVGYVAASACKPFTAAARVGLSLAHERARRWVTLSVPRVAAGRRAQLTVSRYRLKCEDEVRRRRCRHQTVGRATRSAIVLASPRMRLKLPLPREGVRVTARLVLSAFQVGDAPYLRSDVQRTWE